MPSFDIVSEVDMHEVANAIDQSRRELASRFDFRGVDASFELADEVITLAAPEAFQLAQLLDILRQKLAARKVDSAALEEVELIADGKLKKQRWRMRQGVDGDTARTIVKQVKGAKLKVQTAIQGDKVRITGKKRDDLQQVMAMLREAELDLPLQFNNFRD